MAGLEDIARIVLAFTSADVQPRTIEPGQPVLVETVPGIADIGAVGLIQDTLESLGLQQALVDHISLSIRYQLNVQGRPPGEPVQLSPLSADTLPGSDPLKANMLVIPPLVSAETANPAPVSAVLVVTVTVTVEGLVQSRNIEIPLLLVGLPIPTLAVLKTNPADPDWPTNKLMLIVRNGGTTDLGEVLGTLNNALDVLNSVKDIGGFGLAVAGFLTGLGDTVDLINDGSPTVVGVFPEACEDFTEHQDIDDEVRKSIILGPVGTQLRLYSGEDRNANVGGENEVSTFTITEDFGAVAGVSLGFGIHKALDWRNTFWDTDPSDNLDDVESAHFV